jgi:hypothetical protein
LNAAETIAAAIQVLEDERQGTVLRVEDRRRGLIDAQLAILRAAIEFHIDNRQKLWQVALDLARAILGQDA